MPPRTPALLNLCAAWSAAAAAAERPNLVFAIADDSGWPHASIDGNDPVCQTPHFDVIARNVLLFHHASISSPSCTPSRNAILTGPYHGRLGGGPNHSDVPGKAKPKAPKKPAATTARP